MTRYRSISSLFAMQSLLQTTYIKLCLRNLRSVLGCGFKRISGGVGEVFSSLAESREELVVDTLLNEYPRASYAYLPHVEAEMVFCEIMLPNKRSDASLYAHAGPFNCLFYIRVVENNCRALSTELKSDCLEIRLSSRFEDPSARKCASGERQLGNLWVS